jgi:hypothetical protein
MRQHLLLRRRLGGSPLMTRKIHQRYGGSYGGGFVSSILTFAKKAIPRIGSLLVSAAKAAWPKLKPALKDLAGIAAKNAINEGEKYLDRKLSPEEKKEEVANAVLEAEKVQKSLETPTTVVTTPLVSSPASPEVIAVPVPVPVSKKRPAKKRASAAAPLRTRKNPLRGSGISIRPCTSRISSVLAQFD